MLLASAFISDLGPTSTGKAVGACTYKPSTGSCKDDATNYYLVK